MYAGIEAGGTKFNCMIAEHPQLILAEKRIATTDPENTIRQVCDFFRTCMQEKSVTVRSVGIGSFGPLDLDPTSPTFGAITSTPKLAWRNFNIKNAVEAALQIPAVLDTDVNAAALGEYLWGAGKGKDTVLYLTIGTGIGGGITMRGEPLHGMLHPEMGHIYLPISSDEGAFRGICPYHGNCFEGLASGPALQAQWGVEAEELAVDHPAWKREAHIIAQALCNYICILSPHIIILGGGVMQQKQLFPLIHEQVQTLLAGYVQAPGIIDDIESYIVPPGLGNHAGMLGAIGLAQKAVF